MLDRSDLRRLVVKPRAKVRLARIPTRWKGDGPLAGLSAKNLKKHAKDFLEENRRELADAQELLWASDTYSVLVVLQAMDAAGKDGVIKHVMSGINPQGCQVHAFKQPSQEELDHSFLWRSMKALPERGKIVIFNRSHYEDVLIVKVHPEILSRSKLPPGPRGPSFWSGRYSDINNLEHHLARSGTLILKYFLHISKGEQKKRFLQRLDDPDKHWKFSLADLAERQHWDDYQDAYGEMLTHTSTTWAPWRVIPADDKWTARALVAASLTDEIRKLRLRFPATTPQRTRALAAARRSLKAE